MLKICVCYRLTQVFCLFPWERLKLDVGLMSATLVAMQYLTEFNNTTHKDIWNLINLLTFDLKSKQWTTRWVRIPHPWRLICLSWSANELSSSHYKIYCRSLPLSPCFKHLACFLNMTLNITTAVADILHFHQTSFLRNLSFHTIYLSHMYY